MTNSSLGLAHMLANADAVIWLTAVTLLIMSVISWTLIIAKGRSTRRLRMSIAGLASQFWAASDLKTGTVQLSQAEPLPALGVLAQAAIGLQASDGVDALDRHLSHDDRVTRVLRAALHRVRASLESGLVILASIGATAPFVGLFGTVWSIYHALISISGNGQMMLEQVAGPVGEALIMTAFGLFVAIPAVLAYNMLTKSNRTIVSELDGFANDLRAYLSHAHGSGA